MIRFKQFYLVNEASEAVLSKIVSNIPPDQLPFDNIFKGKYRIVQDDEFHVIDPDLEYFSEMMKHEGYEFDFDNGLVKRKDSNNAQKITKFIKNSYESTVKEHFKNVDIPTLKKVVLRRAITHSDESVANFIWRKYKDDIIRWVTELGDSDGNYYGNIAKRLPEVKNKSYHEIRERHFNIPVYRWYEEGGKKEEVSKSIKDHWLEFPALLGKMVINRTVKWQTLLLLIPKLHSLIRNYRIVYTRHPIDVLRMSDFKNIQSCHSIGGSYFECAIQEANDGGIVAYLIPDKDFQKHKNNLQGKDFFYDSDRGVDGVKPEERLRLRTFFNFSKDILLAIPEDRTYGKFANSDVGEKFKEEVAEWARNVQDAPKVFKDITEDKSLFQLYNWTLKGGYYEDTPSSTLFNDFFKDQTSFDNDLIFKGEARKENSSEDDDDQLNQWTVWNNEITQFHEEFSRKVGDYIYAPVTLNDDLSIEFRDGVEFKFKHNTELNFEAVDYNGRKEIMDAKKDILYNQIITNFFEKILHDIKGFYSAHVSLVRDLNIYNKIIDVTIEAPDRVDTPDDVNSFYDTLYGELIHIRDKIYQYLGYVFNEYINMFKTKYIELVKNEDQEVIDKEYQNIEGDCKEWLESFYTADNWSKWYQNSK